MFATDHPIVDLRVLRYPQIWAGSLLAFSVGATLYGGIVIFPQYVQGALGFTATLSGELIFVRAAFIAVGAPLVVAPLDQRQGRHALFAAHRFSFWSGSRNSGSPG